MSPDFLCRCLPAVLLAVPVLAVAQGRPTAMPDPLDAAAPVPPVVHHSSLRARARTADVPVGSWREANDAVARIGGWRSYLREAQTPGPGAASTAAPAERRP